MRIAQISDFHFTRLTWNPLRLFSKRLFGNLNWLLSRKEAFSQKQLEPLPQLFKDLNVDLILLGGDFTTTSLPVEFEEAKKWVGLFSQPWIAIPGNHDHYTYRSYRTKRHYRYFSNPKTSNLILENDGIEVHPISKEWTLIALDTARPTLPHSSQGLLSEALEQKLEETLKTIDTPVILLNHYPFFQNDEPHRRLERGQALEQLIRRHPKIRLYLHGHTHRQTIADLQPGGLPLILDSGSSALGTLGSWNLIDLSPQGCTVTGYRWNSQWTPLRKEEIRWTR